MEKDTVLKHLKDVIGFSGSKGSTQDEVYQFFNWERNEPIWQLWLPQAFKSTVVKKPRP